MRRVAFVISLVVAGDAVYVGNYVREAAMLSTLIDEVRAGGGVYLAGGAFLTRAR